MFPHDKLEWTLTRLERHVTSQPDDATSRMDFALAALSRGWFHGGGEMWLNKSLTQARRVLQHDPDHVQAMLIAGLCLVGMERVDAALRYLDEALRREPESPLLHLGLGELHRVQGEHHQSVRELEMACRLAPDSWECHSLLSQVLWARADELGRPKRLLERSQFHAVRALQLGASQDHRLPLNYHLAMTCVHTKRYADASKLLTRLQDTEKYRQKAKYYLGLVAMHQGKYKNAVLYLRQYLEVVSDHPAVYAKIGQAYLHLGETEKAQQACSRALAIEPTNTQARWTLACALLEQRESEEAERLFKAILSDQPDHIPAFTELVRLHRLERDAAWLFKAIRAEVAGYDRLPLSIQASGRQVNPRIATRNRIAILLKELGALPEDPTEHILGLLDMTTDEGLRLLLWEAALEHTSLARTKRIEPMLTNAGAGYGARAGRELLSLTSFLTEPLLTRGLQIDEEALKRAAVDRHGPANDVLDHRRRVEQERQEARAWQALVLLALAARKTPTARNLLVRWASEADTDLALAAHCALATMGDDSAIRLLRTHSRRHHTEHVLDALVNALRPPALRHRPRPLTSDEDVACATCGRRPTEVSHLITGDGEQAICSRCLTDIARGRRDLVNDDPNAQCLLTGLTNLEDRAVYTYRGVNVASSAVDLSLGLVERDEVDRFLGAL